MYSTVASLHIALDERLQQLNSNRKQSIHPEQYDMAINDAIVTIIKQRCSPILNSKKEGFEESIKRYDDLKSLKQKHTANIYCDINGNEYYDLPSNYYHYITSTGNRLYSRLGIMKSYNYAKEYISVISFDGLVATDYPTEYNTHDVRTLEVPNYNTLVKSDKSKFYYFNLVCEYIKNKYNIDTYYENYKGIYYPNSLVCVTRNIDDAIISTNKEQSVTSTENNISVFSFPLADANYVNMGYAKIDLISSQNDSVKFNNISAKSNEHLNPTCTILNDTITIKTNYQFIIDKIELIYIKKPRLVDSRISQMTDLTITDEILDIATSNLSAILKDNSYQTNKQKEQQNN